jgi:Ras-related protein Rab-8A
MAITADGPDKRSCCTVWKVLVGNKCDMEESKRRVPYSQGQALADEYGIQFFETSAKNNIKVDEVRP